MHTSIANNSRLHLKGFFLNIPCYVLLIFLYLADDTEVIDFKACKDVGDAFDQLFATCQNAGFLKIL